MCPYQHYVMKLKSSWRYDVIVHEHITRAEIKPKISQKYKDQ